MAFGDVLAGFGEAAHQHNVNLLQMDYQNRHTSAEMLQKIAESPDFPQEARQWAMQAALHHLNFAEKIPKEFDVSKGIKIPVSAPPMPPPSPINIPGQQGTSGAPIQIPEGGIPGADLSQSAVPQAATAAIEPRQIQPPTPPPQPPTMRSPLMPYSSTEAVTAQRPAHEEAARAAGAQAAAIAGAQEPSKIREIQARNRMAQIKQESDLARIGYRPKYDLNGDQVGIEPIPPTELSATQQSIVDKNKAANDLAKSKEELNRAEAAWNKSRTDPNSPVNQQILGRLDMLRRRTAVAEASLGLREESQLARYYGIDKQGNPLPGAVTDPVSGQPVGTAFQRIYQPTAATLTKGQTAAPVISQANDLIDFANDPNNEDLFGKVGGRWTELMAGKIGADDPRMARLAPKIRSLASLLAPLHGFRSANAADEFARTMPLMDSPEAFAAAVREYADVAKRVETAARPNTAKAPSAPPSGKMVNVQLSDGRKGQIPENQVPQFLKDNKGSKRLP